MERHRFEGVPDYIYEELKPAKLSVTMAGYRPDRTVVHVGTTLPVKGNCKIIKDLEAKGWKRTRGTVRNGKRYVVLGKDIGGLE